MHKTSKIYQFYNLIESLTVYENLILLSEIKGRTVSLNYLKTITERLKITPLLDFSIPAIKFSNVDFPLPLLPTTATNPKQKD